MLRHLHDQKITTLEHKKFLVKLVGFDYSVIYQAGKENKVADALSRSERSPMLRSVYTEDEPGVFTISNAD